MDVLSSCTVPETVRFNIGGTIYEVSRSLLEQHPETMLARMASETWFPRGHNCGDSKHADEEDDPKKNNDALFIERDGERFRYCLDYMRDGGFVVLPPTIPRDALLHDLSYYGFQEINASKISVKGSLSLLRISHDHIDASLRWLETEKEFIELAHHCLSLYKKTAALETIRLDCGSSSSSSSGSSTADHQAKERRLYGAAGKLETSEIDREQFDAILEKIGLKLDKCEYVRRCGNPCFHLSVGLIE